MQKDRRSHTRVDLVLVCNLGTEDKEFIASTNNLSLSGALIDILSGELSDAEVADITECRFTLMDLPFYIPCEPKRIDASQIALNFKELTSGQMALLKSVINAHSL